MTHINEVAFIIVVVSFAVVTVIGFAAARWRQAELIFRAVRLPAGADETVPADYTADPGEGHAADVPAPAGTAAP